MTGHSLGAGVASVLAVLLKPAYPHLHCYAYSPPGCIFRHVQHCTITKLWHVQHCTITKLWHVQHCTITKPCQNERVIQGCHKEWEQKMPTPRQKCIHILVPIICVCVLCVHFLLALPIPLGVWSILWQPLDEFVCLHVDAWDNTTGIWMTALYCFCLYSLPVSHHSESFITTTILGNDLVSR